RPEAHHPRPAHLADQGGDHPQGTRARRGLLANPELLSTRCPGTRVREVRCVRVAAEGVSGSGDRGPSAVCGFWQEAGGRRQLNSLLPSASCLMPYSVKELFYTLQGEGANAGRPAVFCRFAGCNLWSGREDDRSDAICRFCDTEFVGTDGPGGG